MVSPNISKQHQQEALSIDVISIQSQVVYGCVGNSAAVPTLEQLGYTVASVPTVLLSNTPLYPSVYGGVIDQEWFEGFLQGLIERKTLEKVKAILLGYLGSPEQAHYLIEWLKKIKKEFPQIFIQIDPVLGDIDSGLYVDSRIADCYVNGLAQLANGLTPNHFELEYLTGRKLTTVDQVVEAAKTLLNDTTQWVIVTSALPQMWQDGQMQLLIVNENNVFLQTHPLLKTDAKGTGDVFSASLIAALMKGEDVVTAAEAASRRVMTVIERTDAKGYNELQLIEEKIN